MAKEEKALAKVEVSNYAIMKMDAAELAEAMAENLGDSGGITPFDLNRVHVPSGGGLTFSVPSMDEPDGVEAKEITGVIIYHQTTRAYWQEELTGGGSPPDCSSNDGVTGYGTPGGDCAHCPLNVYGSAAGGKKGKACKEMKAIYLLTEDNLLPTVISCPPSSLSIYKKYMLGLVGKARRYDKVITTISLAKAKSQDGIAYSELVFKYAADIPADQAQAIKAYRDSIVPALTKMAQEFTPIDSDI